MKYIALLRGINVGGKTLIKMADLKSCFENLGCQNVRTYINSGNVIFEAKSAKTKPSAGVIEKRISSQFKLEVRVVVIDQNSYQKMIENVPKNWGQKEGWKYNMLFLIPPYDIKEILSDIGHLKPDIEVVVLGEGVIYQALFFQSFGKTTSGKLATRSSYKKMTIRNWNTARKLLGLINGDE